MTIARRLGLLLAVVLVLGGPASAGELHPTLGELENEVYCPTCHTPLAVSHSPIAERMRVYIRARIAAGDTKSEIKDKLVAEFGESVLAAPPAKGFNLLVWLLPIAGGIVAIAVVAILARRWSRSRPASGDVAEQSANGRAIDPDLQRRLDEELARFE